MGSILQIREACAAVMEEKDNQKATYQAKVRDNFKRNLPMGLIQGVFYYAGMGFYNYGSIFASFVYDISQSELIVGLMATIMSIGYTAAQLFAPSALQHLAFKKKTMLWFGFVSRVPWFIIGFSLLVFPPNTTLGIVIIAYFFLQFFNGLYISSFFDFMSKVIPLEKRGTYFGMRNSLSIVFQAGAGYAAGLLVGQYSYQNGSQYLLPLGYALCFFMAFLVHAVDLWALSRIKEEPALTVGQRTTVSDTIRQIPSVLKGDRNFSKYCVLRSLISLSFYTASFIIVFAKNRIEVTGPMLGIFTAVNLISLSLGTFVSGQIANRIGFKRLVDNVSILMALVYFMSPFLNTFVSFFLFFIGVGFLTGGIFLSFDNLIMEFGHADNRPIYIAIASIISGLSGVVGPLAAGVIANQVSFTALFLVIGFIILIAGYLMKKTVTDPRDIPEYWI